MVIEIQYFSLDQSGKLNTSHAAGMYNLIKPIKIKVNYQCLCPCYHCLSLFLCMKEPHIGRLVYRMIRNLEYHSSVITVYITCQNMNIWEVEDPFTIIFITGFISGSSPPLSGTEPAWSLPVTEISTEIHSPQKTHGWRARNPPPPPFFPNSAHQRKTRTWASFQSV